MREPWPSTVLLDLDGVIRHFDPGHVVSVERRHGLTGGCLTDAAFEDDLLRRLITGRIRRSQWVDEVGCRVGHPAAAAEWLADRGAVDQAVLDVVDRLRTRGHVVAVLTNGTDTIAAEMETLGLVDRFDRIFNSADIGVAKPDRAVFEHVAAELDVDPQRVFFTDDTPSNLTGAVELGMTARPFVDVASLRGHLIEAGFDLADPPHPHDASSTRIPPGSEPEPPPPPSHQC